MQIITAGYTYMDIDAYGGCAAYAELLNVLGTPARAVSIAQLNASISPLVRSWGIAVEQTYTPDPRDRYVLIDISEPAFFEKFVDTERVTEIIDHHLGFEQFWQDKIGKNAHIEFVGAACTLVYERWEAAGMLPHISSRSARLLMCGILDNTLNLGATITTSRDQAAYQALQAYADFDGGLAAEYFADCEAAILQDITQAMRDDYKPTVGYPSLDHTVGAWQLALWDANLALREHMPAITAQMAPRQPGYFNLISLKEKCSYFICPDASLQLWLSKLLDVTFHDNIAKAPRMWLRKEIMKQAIEGGNP
jgi:hypothetical protein